MPGIIYAGHTVTPNNLCNSALNLVYECINETNITSRSVLFMIIRDMTYYDNFDEIVSKRI